MAVIFLSSNAADAAALSRVMFPRRLQSLSEGTTTYTGISLNLTRIASLGDKD
jgi:hypothetical protein